MSFEAEKIDFWGWSYDGDALAQAVSFWGWEPPGWELRMWWPVL